MTSDNGVDAQELTDLTDDEVSEDTAVDETVESDAVESEDSETADEDVDVVAVGDGDAAIARLDSSPPDIVLADVAMPGKTGYDVAQHIKKTPRLAHSPVVLLTGAFEPIDRSRAAAVSCDGLVVGARRG